MFTLWGPLTMFLRNVGDFHCRVAAGNVQRSPWHNFLGPYHGWFIQILSSWIMDIIEIPTKPQSTTPDLTKSVSTTPKYPKYVQSPGVFDISPLTITLVFRNLQDLSFHFFLHQVLLPFLHGFPETPEMETASERHQEPTGCDL